MNSLLGRILLWSLGAVVIGAAASGWWMYRNLLAQTDAFFDRQLRETALALRHQAFEFAVVGPREVGQESFREGKVIETALKSFAEVGKELRANVAVFLSPPDFSSSRANKTAVKDFLANVKASFGRVVWAAADMPFTAW